MSQPADRNDFESQWQDKLARAVETLAGRETREGVMPGGAELSDGSPAREKLAWTCQALERLAQSADLETRQEILTQCACQYPPEDLEDVHQVYQQNRDLDQVMALLQARFESFLREGLDLEEDLIEQITSWGWGLAGVREGNTITATKIPKSGYLREYFQEEDPLKKRQLYCHCPRVRDMVGSQPGLPEEYCCCGAGFYRGIWEEILGEPVQVEVLKSVMGGDQVCQIAVHLPDQDC